MVTRLRRIKPGWYLLLALLVYGLVVTVALSRSARTIRDLRTVLDERSAEPVAEPPTPFSPEGLWFPIPGAALPQDATYLPGAPRVYRSGINQGFDFYGEDAGIPIGYGTPVIAAEDAIVTRVDGEYQELDVGVWDDLLAEVAENGADEAQLNHLRGRQIWLRTDAGLELRYAHLSRPAEGLAEGERVYRGEVIGYVGNSGTDDAVTGTTRGARLHFEVWQPDGSFFGQGLDETTLRDSAQALFVGP